MPYHLPVEFSNIAASNTNSVLLQTCRFDQDNYQSWLFTAPITTLSIYSTTQIPELFAKIESFLLQNYFIAGYFNYECGYHFENIFKPYTATAPIAWFGVYPQALVFNHQTPQNDLNTSQDEHNANNVSLDRFLVTDLHFNLNANEYYQKIDQIKEYIHAGDVYQINFTGKYTFNFSGSALELYRFLIKQQPVSYAAYINTDQRQIISLSPELFFRRKGSQITTKPMKGTATRGKTNAEDRYLATLLEQDIKNRAENLMIVDLIRNDLGRIAKTGSVRVPEIFTVEKYQSLLQMTSTITAELATDIKYYQLFKSLFPCGSVTGAPKIRSMQLIRELEPASRGVYTGAIGFFSPDNEAIFSVAIRSIELYGNYGEIGVGSGIVYDSTPEAEFQECKLKANFFTVRQPDFELIESILWDGDFQFLDRHLLRLEDSCSYFDFNFDLSLINEQLNKVIKNLETGRKYKIRFTLNQRGKITIATEPISNPDDSTRNRIRLSEITTDSQDIFLYHKTTNRDFYNKMHQEAIKSGLVDIIFKNERDEITEGTISNILIEKDGVFYTPPLTSGLLNGVYRSYLIDTNPNLVEQVLYESDLVNADNIYLCNAVRGLRKVFLSHS